MSKYFTVKKLCVKNEVLRADTKTFQCLTCVKGQGEIDGQTMQTVVMNVVGDEEK